ncbi:MAG: glycine cleavage system aminomethyltransferase GcvT [Thermoguttaceae bacterium]|nr:glycine cleavage system aminomethyltransferase GcvT [Thermoguttaceae bacterium]
MSELKRTPFYEKEIAAGGKMIDFGGWALPVQYEGILKEHKRVRENAGLFDVSHMGEILVKGEEARGFVQSIIANDLDRIGTGQAIYSPICYDDGGTVDDLIVYQIAEDEYFIVVNAANVEKDFDWFCQHAPEGLTVENISSEIAQLAVQGPKAQEVLQRITDYDLSTIKFFHFAANVKLVGSEAIVSRTGYTGEDGFEIYINAKEGPALWDAILDAGKDDIAPIGLGARDTLRFEAKLPLYGHEITKEISPVEAGLGFFIRPEKEAGFHGKAALAAQKEGALTRKVVEFEMVGRGIPREGYPVAVEGKEVGWVTSGMFAPTLGKNMGLAILPKEFTEPGTKIDVIIRGRSVPAEVKKGIFYSKKTKSKKNA